MATILYDFCGTLITNPKNQDMKKILLAALPIAAIAVMALTPVSDPLPIGSNIPEIGAKMKDISGKEISFKESFKENGLLVMFSCNTCPVVQKYESRTVGIMQKSHG
ncbi:MAG: hypothetical protein WDO16_23950 [Bacteroidota bacterium]